MASAKQTQARLIDQRARRRATQALIEKHPEEYYELLQEALREARSEASQLQVTVTRAHGHEMPARIMPGRRLAGQTAVDRIDVARCPECVSYHDAGHTCGRCGSPAEAPKPVPRNNLDRAVLRMVERGLTDARIAVDLGITEDAVVSRRAYLGLAGAG